MSEGELKKRISSLSDGIDSIGLSHYDADVFAVLDEAAKEFQEWVKERYPTLTDGSAAAKEALRTVEKLNREGYYKDEKIILLIQKWFGIPS